MKVVCSRQTGVVFPSLLWLWLNEYKDQFNCNHHSTLRQWTVCRVKPVGFFQTEKNKYKTKCLLHKNKYLATILKVGNVQDIKVFIKLYRLNYMHG